LVDYPVQESKDMHNSGCRSQACACHRSLFALPAQWFTARPVVRCLSFARFALPWLINESAILVGQRFVEEASAQLDRPERSLSLMEGVTNKTFKDEPMTEPTITATAESTDQRARSSDFNKLLIALVDHPEAWLSTPSAHFGGRKPRDLVGTDEEYKLFDLLQAVDQGLF